MKKIAIFVVCMILAISFSAFFTSADPLINVTATPTDNTAGVSTTYTIVFTTITPLTAAVTPDQIVITFLAGFDASGATVDGATVTQSGSDPALASATATIVILDVAADESAGTQSIVLSGIINTQTAGTEKTVNVETKDGDNAYVTLDGPTDSTSFAISAAAVATLTVQTQPSAAVAGVAIAPPIEIVAKDAFNNVVPGAPIAVVLQIGTGTLSGTTPETTDASGIASFNDLSIDLVGTDKVLRFSSNGITVDSVTFTISAAAVATLTVQTQPSAAVAGVAIAPPIEIVAKDAFNNVVPGAPIAVVLQIGTGTLSGTTPETTDASGIASFNDLSIDLVGTDKVLRFSSNGITVDSVTFTISAAAVTIAAIPGITVPVTGGTPVSVITETAQYTGTVTWNPTDNPFAGGTVYTATITLTAKTGFTFTGVAANFFTVAGATTVTNAADSGVVTAAFPATITAPVAVTIAAIPGITVPVTGGTPVSVITETAQYTGTVTWNPTDNPFAGGTVYTATITLTAKTGFTFTGVAANFFTVAGATTVTNAADSGVVTAAFPATITAPVAVTIAAIPGITVPVTGGTPVSVITETAQYTGTVTWNPTDNPFAGGTVYTATITLTAKTGFTFTGVPANFFTVAGATTVTNAADSGVVTAAFPATITAPVAVTIAAIPGITVPVTGGTPVSVITETAQYTGTVTWNPTDNPFAGGTVYTATITLTAKTGFTFTGVPANFFTVAGATTVTNAADSGVVTAAFPATITAPVAVTIAAIPGITVPVTGGTPVSVITETAQYTGTVTWNPTDNPFAGGTVYTATITLTAKTGFTFTGVPANFFTVAGATTVTNAADSGVVTAAFPATITAPVAVTIAAIPGITVPVTGGTPVSVITETAQYTGTVTWNPTDNPFAGGTVYTATITLTAKTGFTFTGVPANFFTVAGATTVTNAADSGVVTAAFPATITAPVAVTIAAIPGITVPVTGGTPVSVITETAQYTGTVTWNPTDNPFAGGTVYTATITLTAKTGFTFTGVPANFFTVAGATTVTNAADSGVVTAAFPATITAPVAVTIAAIPGITVPVTGGTPVSVITETAQYTGTVTWNPTDNPFAGGTVYTATITLTAKTGFTFTGVPANFFTVAGATTVTNAADSGVVTAAFPATITAPVAVTIAAIPGITVPVTGGTPVSVITETAQYTGTVTWNPTDNPFAGGTVYTATITLTAKTGFTFTGVPANFFTVAGATTVTNAADSGVVTAAFPATITAPVAVTIAAIPGITVPVTGGTPVSVITETAQYTGTVTWNPTDNPFAGGTVYTATITLTAKTGFTFTGVPANFFTVAGATTVTNAADSGVVTAAFPTTAAAVPVFTDNSPTKGTTGDPFTFNITTSNTIHISSVNVTWTHGTLNGTNVSFTSKDNKTWNRTITLDNNLSNMTYTITVTDTSHNKTKGPKKTVPVTDNDKPGIIDHTPTVAHAGHLFTFNTTVTDNIHVSEVQVEYWFDDYVHFHTKMINTGGNLWQKTIDVNLTVISLQYTISAVDSSRNWMNNSAKVVTIAPDHSPSTPDQPTGPASGIIYTEYTYRTSTTDPDGDQLYYKWSWGENISGWLGPFKSGEIMYVEHSWNVKGSYEIKVKAKDAHGLESDWSDPLPIKMPYTFNRPLFQFLELLFQRFPHAFPILRQLLGY